MLLSDIDIENFIDAGEINITPYNRSLLQPSSIDVRLGLQFRIFNSHRYTHIDPAQQQDDLTTLVELSSFGCFILHPGEFALASTKETITLPDTCLLYTSDAADEEDSVDLGGRRIIKKKKKKKFFFFFFLFFFFFFFFKQKTAYEM